MEIASCRGAADALALRARYCDALLHADLLPSGQFAGVLHEVLEQARVETLGIIQYRGCRSNLAALGRKRTATTDVLENQALYEIVAEHVASIFRSRTLANGDTASTDRKPAAVLQQLIERSSGDLLDVLTLQVRNQRSFAQVVAAIATSLTHVEELLCQAELGAERLADSAEAREWEAAAKTQPENPANTSEASGSEIISIDGESEVSGSGGQEASPKVSMTGSAGGRAGARPGEASLYRIYSALHDEIISARQLAAPDEMRRLRGILDRRIRTEERSPRRIARSFDRRLMTYQRSARAPASESGLIDPRHLARIVCSPYATPVYKSAANEKVNRTVVSILIDVSGSMRGRPISFAAATSDWLAQVLERCGVKVEVLGFTTGQWNGGESRKLWVLRGRAPNPGRLTDIRHIVFKSVNQSWRSVRGDFAGMLREGVAKENVDGEALLWAHRRLNAHSEHRKILVVVSDGDPGDDSTTSANSHDYLASHLRNVAARIQSRSGVELLAIGIGHDVTPYYGRATTIADASDLSIALSTGILELFSPGRSRVQVVKGR